jgi:hypothetical protein
LLHDAGHTIPLSWYSTVMDWFEQGLNDYPSVRAPAPNSAGSATPVFKGANSGTGGRFKRPRTTAQ